MSNRYSLVRTDSPAPTYRVIDHSMDDEPALHPATLPSGAPHPLAGTPIATVSSPSPARYRVEGAGRARTWSELGGYAVAIVERIPSWAAAPSPTVLREDSAAFDGIPADLIDSPSKSLSIRPWFATTLDVHTSTRRWQDRYAAAIAHAPSPAVALDRVQDAL